jgi:CheY-like chemotaxis protein
MRDCTATRVPRVRPHSPQHDREKRIAAAAFDERGARAACPWIPRPQACSSPLSMSPTVLVVDDCADIARIIARYLESAAYRAVTAASGTEALAIVQRATPDCIILDLMMPGMSGAELLHALRHEDATKSIPVILVSARVGYHGTHFRSQVDADYSVGKPFTRQQIVQAVRTVLARKAGVELEPLPAPPPPRVDARARIAAELARAGYLPR